MNMGHAPGGFGSSIAHIAGKGKWRMSIFHTQSLPKEPVLFSRPFRTIILQNKPKEEGP